jgi:hypothetical protein
MEVDNYSIDEEIKSITMKLCAESQYYPTEVERVVRRVYMTGIPSSDIESTFRLAFQLPYNLSYCIDLILSSLGK